MFEILDNYKRNLFLVAVIFFTVNSFAQSLVINEVSNGVGGSEQEYIELLVTSSGDCAPCVDLRGWIIDDNNGLVGSSVSSSNGACRFSYNSIWECVKAGTIITVYNDSDRNPKLSSDDLDESNCRFVLPISSLYFDRHLSQPNNGDQTYSLTDWLSGGDWTTVSLRDEGDGVLLFSPNNLINPSHSVSWGDNAANQTVYFPGSNENKVIAAGNSNGCDFQDNSNFESLDISGSETPNTGNNFQNETCILALNNNCSPKESPLQVAFITGADVTCKSSCTGKARVELSGGTLPYTFSWSNGNTNQNPNDLCVGKHYVSVEDNSGCIVADSVEIGEPTLALNANVVIDSLPKCKGGNGGVKVLSSGGFGTYIYSWEDDFGTRNETVNFLSGIKAGNYTVTVNDFNGCVKVENVNISEPSSNIEINSTSNSTNCGTLNGSISATVAGGNGSYQYAWKDINGTRPETFSTLTNVAGGYYVLSVSDGNGCKVDSTIFVESTGGGTVAASVVQQAGDCFGDSSGQATVNVSGGTSPYTYSWTDEDGTKIWNLGNISDLKAGSYTITVEDNNNCIGASAIEITHPEQLEMTVLKTDVTCKGANNGVLVCIPSGGTGTYTYLWSNSDPDDIAEGLEPKDYTITVLDTKGCIAFEKHTITEPSNSTSAIISIDSKVTCKGSKNGALSVNGTGGTGMFNYSWSNGETTPSISGLSGATYVVTVKDEAGCSIIISETLEEASEGLAVQIIIDSNVSCKNEANGGLTALSIGGVLPYTYSWSNFAVSPTIETLEDGVYKLKLSDANGCEVTLGQEITEPSTALNANITLIKNVSCFEGADGSLTTNATGGATPYTYLWSNGSTLDTIRGLSAEEYTVVVTDVNKCTSQNSYLVSEPASSISVDAFNITLATCQSFDGSAEIISSGGTGAHSFIWEDFPINSTNQITAVDSGDYKLRITDANSCFIDTLVTVGSAGGGTITVLNQFSEKCTGDCSGKAEVSMVGGTSPYTYTWSNGSGDAPINSTLCAGSGTVTVVDNDGCIASKTFFTGSPSPLVVNIQVTQAISCNDANDGVTGTEGNDGVLTAATSGGTGAYTYIWNTLNTSQTINNLTENTYTVTVSDNNGCQKVSSKVLPAPPKLSASITVNQHVECKGGNSGELKATAIGGQGAYTYSWSNSKNTQTISTLLAGTYTLVLKDSKNCSVTTNKVITEPANYLAVSVASTPTICSANNGELLASVSGGTPSYTYNWSNGGTINPIKNLSNNGGAAYSLLVTDANNCTVSAFQTVNKIVNTINGVVLSKSDPSCDSANDGFAKVSASGGSPSYTYTWEGSGIVGATNASLSEGNFTVNITDRNGCTGTINAALNDIAPVKVQIQNIDAFGCEGEDGRVLVTASGGGIESLDDVVFNWSNGETGYYVTGLSSGQYKIVASDLVNGCKGDTTFYDDFFNVPPIADFTMEYSEPLIYSQDVKFYGEANKTIGIWTWEFRDTTGSDLLGKKSLEETEFTFPSVAGDYFIKLVVTDNIGCKDSVEHLLHINSVSNVFVPNSFTPGNQDGYNDTFKPILNGVRENTYQFAIFSRLGEEIFHTNNVDDYWGGSLKRSNSSNLAKEGLYVYIIQYEDVFGERQTVTGHINLLR